MMSMKLGENIWRASPAAAAAAAARESNNQLQLVFSLIMMRQTGQDTNRQERLEVEDVGWTLAIYTRQVINFISQLIWAIKEQFCS